MISVGAYEAKTNLARLLEQVAQGEQITITKHGVPVARLVPASGQEPLGRDAAIVRLTELSKGLTLDGLSIKDMIAEGRKY